METHQQVPFVFLRYMSYCKHCYGNNNVFTLALLINFMSLSTIYTYLNLHLSCLKYVACFNQSGFFRQIFIKVCNIKCNETTSSWIQVDTCGQTEQSKHALFTTMRMCIKKKKLTVRKILPASHLSDAKIFRDIKPFLHFGGWQGEYNRTDEKLRTFLTWCQVVQGLYSTCLHSRGK